MNARHSDFAFVCAAAQVALDEAGRCAACAIGIGGLGEFPIRLDDAAEALIGTDLSDAAMTNAVDAAMADLDIWGDLHASALSPAHRRSPGTARLERCAASRSGEATMKIELSHQRRRPAAPTSSRARRLLDCLRDDFGLTGTHAGCEHGVCGACTVLLDGEPVRSCLMFAVQADGYEITTIEGIAPAPASSASSRMRSARCTACNAAIARRAC